MMVTGAKGDPPTAVEERMHRQNVIDQQIEAWTKELPNKEVESRLKAVCIPAEPMRRINDGIDSEDRSTVFSKIEERRIGSMLTTRLPFSLSSVSLPTPRSAPSLGEHNRKALRE
jgi:crotonobetainyl-CoA:carnitine CoA-transferase CaiB-like acyl-CoA transferase